MGKKPQPQKRRDISLSSLNAATTTLKLAKDLSGMTPAKAILVSVITLLTMIKDNMADDTDCVELGLACADVCKVIMRVVNGKQLDALDPSVREAIERLKTTVVEIQESVEKGGRNVLSRVFHTKNYNDVVTGWWSELTRALHTFDQQPSPKL